MPIDEGGAESIEGERARDAQRLAGGDVGVDLGVGGRAEVHTGRADGFRPRAGGRVDHAVPGEQGAHAASRCPRQRATASAAEAGLPNTAPVEGEQRVAPDDERVGGVHCAGRRLATSEDCDCGVRIREVDVVFGHARDDDLRVEPGVT